MSFNDTACIVLAGGLGTRLKSVVSDSPKSLSPIRGKPFLELLLASLSKRGIDNFVLSLGYGSEYVLSALKDPWAHNLFITTVVENELLGTGGAIRFVMDKLGLEEAIVVNGDTFLAGVLDNILTPLSVSSNELMRIATVRVNDRSRFGGLVINNNNRVTDFIEKGCLGPGIINAGMYRIHRSIFDFELPKIFSLENDLMPCLVDSSLISACDILGPFIDIGVPDDYFRFNEYLEDYLDA